MNSTSLFQYGVSLFLCLSLSTLVRSALPTRGRNVCQSYPGGCCPGWSRKGNRGRCVSAICTHGCNGGTCIGPNKCRCLDNSVRVTCSTAQGKAKLKPEIKHLDNQEYQCRLKGCQQNCSVVYGSARCRCARGYVLQPDIVTCADVDECAEHRFVCHHLCINTIGSFKCGCRTGYRLAYNKRICVRGTVLFDTSSNKRIQTSQRVRSRVMPKNLSATYVKKKTEDQNYKRKSKYIGIRVNEHGRKEGDNLRKSINVTRSENTDYKKSTNKHIQDSSGSISNTSESVNHTNYTQNDQCRGDLCRNLKRSIDDDEIIPKLILSTPTTMKNEKETLQQPTPPMPPQELVATKDRLSIKCPRGETIVNTGNRKICRKVQTLCSNGEAPVEEGGLIVCRNSNVTCPKGQTPRATSSGIMCQYISEEETTTPAADCPDGKMLISSAAGYTCEDITKFRPTCSDQEVLVESETGFICISIEFQKSKCSQDEIPVQGPNGFQCVKATTEPPCPAGLQSVKTSVGTICSYVSENIVKLPNCSIDEQLVTTETGYKCVRTTTERRVSSNLTCLPGQVRINTTEGPKCGFVPEYAAEKIVCPAGQVLIDDIICKDQNMISPDEQPCPADQELVKTKDGVICQYRESSYPKITNNRISWCPNGEILTQTRDRFVCQSIQPGYLTPSCTTGESIVRSSEGIIYCVSDEQANIICDNDQILTQKSNGFMCKVMEAGGYLEKAYGTCQDGEILLVDEEGSRCIHLVSKNLDICGDGFKIKKTINGYVCKPLLLKLECPVNFYLDQSNGYPVCLPMTDEGETDTSPPCGSNYELKETEVGTRCVLMNRSACPEDDGDCVPVDSPDCRSTGGEYRIIDCRDLSSLQLDCNPQCANGGTCQNGICKCPPGLAGFACNEDVDECNRLTKGYCQYRCENTFGSYHCECPNWATLNSDGRTCTDIGCVPECMNGGKCRNGTCECPVNFRGVHCQDDVDECAEKNNLCEYFCRNTYGGYACVCPPGSKLAQDQRTCINTTCIPGCRNGGQCVHNRCQCKEGFWGIICQLDIDECFDSPCSHSCVNTPGSYYCTCPQGSELGSNMHTCYVTNTVVPVNRTTSRP